MDVKLTLLVLVAVAIVFNTPAAADYIWHNDEIPYDPKAKCYRGHSYYSNSLTANDTDIDIGSEVESLLDYNNENTCYFCVCSVAGNAVGCVHRDIQYCNFFRAIRNEKSIRDRYMTLLEQDRPTYFRQLSWRMRRTMDTNMFDLINHGGDSLCCNHPYGHRWMIHNGVHNKLRALKKRLPKENLLGGTMREDYVDFIVNNDLSGGIVDSDGVIDGGSKTETKKCVPLVSEYSTCTEDNLCTGCTKCTCNGEGEWVCEEVHECDERERSDAAMAAEDEIFDNALMMLEFEMKKKKYLESRKPTPNLGKAPSPQATKKNAILGMSVLKEYKMDDILYNLRSKRSSTNKNNKHNKRSVEKINNKHASKTNNKILVTNNNNTVKFYDTVDELNEDTLKASNFTGTITAKKMEMLPQLSSRRSGDAENISKPLQIEYNRSKVYNPINDNKIDTTEHENKFDSSHENLKFILGNHSEIEKDKDLSKIVVNELKNGSEVIGDTSAPVTSNITFTSENDTLTAMAFIAGNLLNKLWDMEKDVSEASMETDAIKHEKISDLLELFKEPLNLRQETFLKNALEHLTRAIDKDKEVKNISICANIKEANKLLFNTSGEDRSNTVKKVPCDEDKEKIEEDKQKLAAVKAIKKINNVLELIRKFEAVQRNLSELQHGSKFNFSANRTSPNSRNLAPDTILTKEEKSSLNIFGNILEKITKFLMPKRNNKKIVKQIKSLNVMGDHDSGIKKKFKKLYNIDLTNMTVTAKDKLILDYLTHVDTNPNCLLNKNNHRLPKLLPSIDGNILLNLSEFFRMKSYSDLIKILDPDNSQKYDDLRSITPVPTQKPSTTTRVVDSTTVRAKSKAISKSRDIDAHKLNSTKEKLKAHLKTIIEDLAELQNVKGLNLKGNIKIADALPCIYNVLNAGKEEIVAKNYDDVDPMINIANMFNELKNEIKVVKTRRNQGNIVRERPKSAAIWERIIKNLNDKSNLKNRRFLNTKAPKAYSEIRNLMNKLENSSSTYKRYALQGEVPATGRLMMLKALELDVKNSIDALEEIKISFENLIKLPSQTVKELEEFINNVATSININDKVNLKLQQELKKLSVKENEINSSNRILQTRFMKKSSPEGVRYRPNDDLTISRTQIMNQLIRNRMIAYLKMRDDQESDATNDMSYNIAKRVLHYLDAGNYDLAKEMFKIFVMQKNGNSAFSSNNDNINDKYVLTPPPNFSENPMMRRMGGLPAKHPIVQFGDPNGMNKKINWINQDHLIKQLMNIKNMGM